MGVSRAELQAVKLERQGDAEEAAKFRVRAEELRYEDPYTALQDQLDEAVKNEVGVLSWCVSSSSWSRTVSGPPTRTRWKKLS